MLKCSTQKQHFGALKKVCRYVMTWKVEITLKHENSYFAESSTHALLFTNQGVFGEFDGAPMEIHSDKEKPACILINKTVLKR